MSNVKRPGSVRVGRFIAERIRARGWSVAYVARLIEDNEAPQRRITRDKLEKVIAGETTLTIQQSMMLAKFVRFNARRLFDLIELDRYNDLVPGTNSVKELMKLGKDAYRAADFPLACVAWEKAARLTKVKETKLDALGNFASALFYMGMIDGAIAVNLDLIGLDGLSRIRRASLHCNLSFYFESRGNLRSGLSHSDRALELLLEGNPALRANILLNRANIFANRWDLETLSNPADLDVAIGIYSEVLRIAETVPGTVERFKAIGNIGRCQVAKGEVENGISQLVDAQRLAMDASDEYHVTYFGAELGKAFYVAGNREMATRSLRRAYTSAQKSGFIDLQVFTAIYLAKIARDGGAEWNEYDRVIQALRWKVTRKIREVLDYTGPAALSETGHAS